MKLPHRHDLIPSSCVNNEVLKFNRQVEKKMKIYNNVRMLETDLNRRYFTKYGQHLNISGKELISVKFTVVTKEFFNRKRLSPICQQWKNSVSEGLKSRLLKTEVQLVYPGVLNHNILDELSRISHPSKQQRKNVALRNLDSLWT